jgi:hypothetical protein
MMVAIMLMDQAGSGRHSVSSIVHAGFPQISAMPPSSSIMQDAERAAAAAQIKTLHIVQPDPHAAECEDGHGGRKSSRQSDAAVAEKIEGARTDIGRAPVPIVTACR